IRPTSTATSRPLPAWPRVPTSSRTSYCRSISAACADRRFRTSTAPACGVVLPPHPTPMQYLLPLFIALFTSAPSFTQQPPADPWPDQLVGRWEGALGMGTYTEEWKKVSDGTYEGV